MSFFSVFVCSHRRQHCKLRGYRIIGETLTWITNWLAERKQRVISNGQMSEWSKDPCSGLNFLFSSSTTFQTVLQITLKCTLTTSRSLNSSSLKLIFLFVKMTLTRRLSGHTLGICILIGMVDRFKKPV